MKNNFYQLSIIVKNSCEIRIDNHDKYRCGLEFVPRESGWFYVFILFVSSKKGKNQMLSS